MHPKLSRSSSRIYIDLTDEDESLCSDSEKCRKGMSALQTQVLALQKENSDLRSKLTVAQSELGKAVVANVMQVDYSTTKGDVEPAASSKRPWSPSLEIVCTPWKGRVKEEIMSSKPKKIKVEESVKTSPSQMRAQMASFLTRPIAPRAEPEPFRMVTRSHSSLKLKRPGVACPSTTSSSDASPQPDLNPCSSTTKVIPPSRRISSPLITGPSPWKSKGASAGGEKLVVTQGGHDSNLLLKSLKKHLKSAPTLPIHPPPLKARLKRVPFAKCYGGCNQHFLQHIPADRNPSGDIKRNLVFPQPPHNPALPVDPGEPGLIFASRHEVADGTPWSLFVKHDPTVTVWTYLGDYKGVVCGRLTSDQFKTLSKTGQDTWVKRLLTQKSGIYLKMRIRIALRKGGLIPLDNKTEEEKLIVESMACQSDFKVTGEDIRTALYKGDEAIDLILMTCISYDHVFANDIRRNFTEAGTRRQTVGHVATPDSDSDASADEQSDSANDIY